MARVFFHGTPQPNPAQDDMATALTLEQKRTLYRDGYIILRNAVSKELVETARQRIRTANEGEILSKAKEMTDLINASSITPILTEAMGQFDPPIAGQVGVREVSEPGDHFNNLGYRERDMPYYAAGLHVDGSMTIAGPAEAAGGHPGGDLQPVCGVRPEG